MNVKALRVEIEEDLKKSPSQAVIYLEGKTDPAILFGLLGSPTPSDDVHQGVLVRGLQDVGKRKGSGSTAVMSRVDVARQFNMAGVFGVVDGDGLPLDALASNFDPPHPGPLFRWKAYCIENLLAKTGWPSGWDSIDWRVELSKYGSYVALNCMHRELRDVLTTLDLFQFSVPSEGQPLKSPPDILAALEADKHHLRNYDVALRFQEELTSFLAIVQNDLNEAHALLNGKWFLQHLAPSITGLKAERCRSEWIEHARSVGGLGEVREWWERIIGSPEKSAESG